MEFTKKNTIVFIVVTLLVVAFVSCCALFSHFCAIGFADMSDAMPCTSIVFDKHMMLAVDQIELYNSQTKKSLVIKENDVIQEFVEETMVATNTDVQCPKDIEIKLYSGDKLVRIMYCGIDYTFVNVYNPDKLHLYLFKVTEPGEGYVLLSKDLQQMLMSLEL